MTSSTAPTNGRVLSERATARREAILDAAAALFAERGYSATDTQELADRLGVGKGTLYRYFPSKRELFLAAADRVMRRLRQTMADDLEGVEEPIERIKIGVRTFLTYAREHPEFAELLVQERAQFRDRPQTTYFQHRDEYVAEWHAIYRDLIRAGRLRDIPVDRITDVIGRTLYGAVFMDYFGGSRKNAAEQAVDTIDILLRGILSDSERTRPA